MLLLLLLFPLPYICYSQLALADTYAYNVPDTEIAALQDLYDADQRRLLDLERHRQPVELHGPQSLLRPLARHQLHGGSL